MGQSIRVLIFEEQGAFVAQCLDYDICAQGSDLETARANLMETLDAEAQEGVRAHGAPFAGIGPAPAHFEESWSEDGEALPGQTPLAAGGSDLHVDMKLAA